MSDPLVQTALYIRDLLSYDESLIKPGRQGSEIKDYAIGYIAVDTLGSTGRLGGGSNFNGDAEVMTYYNRSSVPIVLSFYGDGAWDRATLFSLLIESQSSLELQKTLGIAVYNARDITDVKLLTGQQYGERVELTFTFQQTNSADVGTLRIDEAQISILSESGTEIEP